MQTRKVRTENSQTQRVRRDDTLLRNRRYLAWSSLAGLPAISRIVLALLPGARKGPSTACRAGTNSVLAERAPSRVEMGS